MTDREWLADLIVSQNRETRETLREDIKRVDDRAIEAHHRLRQDVQKMTNASIRVETELKGKVSDHERRISAIESSRHPRRRTDPSEADYRLGPRLRERLVTEREVKLVLYTLSAVGSVLLFVTKIWPALSRLFVAGKP